jgi:hypothetical protein
MGHVARICYCTRNAGAEIGKLLEALPLAHRKLVIIDTDPDRLLAKLTDLLDKLNSPYRKIYRT